MHTANSMRLNRRMRAIDFTLTSFAATVSRTAASAAVGRCGSRSAPTTPTARTMRAATRPTTCDFPLAAATTEVRGGEVFTAKAPD